MVPIIKELELEDWTMARMEWIELEPTPPNEPCQQIGPKYDRDIAKLEARVYANQLRNQFPNHDKVTIRVKTHYKDYTWFEVWVGFNPECDESIKQAYDIESRSYLNWTNESKNELKNGIDTIKFNREASYSNRI
jgi:hypothetical protein